MVDAVRQMAAENAVADGLAAVPWRRFIGLTILIHAVCAIASVAMANSLSRDMASAMGIPWRREPEGGSGRASGGSSRDVPEGPPAGERLSACVQDSVNAVCGGPAARRVTSGRRLPVRPAVLIHQWNWITRSNPVICQRRRSDHHDGKTYVSSISPTSALRVSAGPLGSARYGFADRLATEGNARFTIGWKLAATKDLGGWLEREDLAAESLDEQRVEAFLQTREPRRRARRGEAAAGRQLLGHLGTNGKIPAAMPAPGPVSPIDRITGGYQRFLLNERGLGQPTVRTCLPIARAFLTQRFASQPMALRSLSARDGNQFVLHVARPLSRARSQLVVTAIRSFLRHLRQRGDIHQLGAQRLARHRTPVVPALATHESTRLGPLVQPSRERPSMARPAVPHDVRLGPDFNEALKHQQFSVPATYRILIAKALPCTYDPPCGRLQC